jgi:hypothetical protein
MHSLVFVILPAGTGNVNAEVERLLSGSERCPGRRFKEFEVRCFCIGFTTSNECYERFDTSVEGKRIHTQLEEARLQGNSDKEALLLKTRFTAVRAMARQHPLWGKPDSQCDVCHGSGHFTQNHDPRTKWDYWQIGGRWSKLFAVCPSVPEVRDENLEGNVARVNTLPADLLPYAIVTPEGDWWEEEGSGFHLPNPEPEEEADRRKWELEANRLLCHYPDHLAVVVDCHD